MNLPLPELFYWGSRPKMLRHHLRWQKFLQQVTIQQQRQGSPHTACCYWQFGSAAVVICQHTPQNPSPAPAMGAKYIPWWVQNTGTASPTPCALVCQGIISSQCCDSAQAPFPCSSRSPTLSTYIPGIYRGCSGTQGAEHFIQICISSYPKHEQGIHPSWPVQAGAEEKFHTKLLAQGALTEPEEQ